jgi:hypothetical protein
VTILTGDVHCAGAGVFEPLPDVAANMTQTQEAVQSRLYDIHYPTATIPPLSDASLERPIGQLVNPAATELLARRPAQVGSVVAASPTSETQPRLDGYSSGTEQTARAVDAQTRAQNLMETAGVAPAEGTERRGGARN